MISCNDNMRWVWYGAVPSSLRTAVRVLLSVLFPAALCAIFCGCHRSVDVSTMCDVPPGGWSAPVSVCYDNTDTTALYTLSFAVRHNGVAGGELRADVMFTAPDSTTFTESVVLPLREHRRSATVALVESVPYRREVHLRQSGRYTMVITPENEVRGIESVGLLFDKE